MEEQNLEELLDSYPETVKNRIIRTLLGEEIVELGMSHGLRVDDQALLYTMVRNILIGKKSGQAVLSEFQLLSTLPEEKTSALIHDVNVKILTPIQDLMRAESEVSQIIPSLNREIFGDTEKDAEAEHENINTLERLFSDELDFKADKNIKEILTESTTQILPDMGREAESIPQTTGTSPFLNRPNTTINLNKSIVKGDLKSISRESVENESKNPLPVDKYREAVE